MSRPRVPLELSDLEALLKDCISLAYAVQRFLNFHELLREELEGRSLGELITQEKYRRMLLGGMKADLKFVENAIAEFYRRIYGVNFDVSSLAAGLDAGLSFEEAASSVTVGKEAKAEELSAFHDLKQTIYRILSLGKESVERYCERRELVEELNKACDLLSKGCVSLSVENGREGVKIVEELINHALSLSPNYNEITMRIISLRRIPWFYVTAAFKDITSEEYLEFLRDVLGWSEYFSPEVSQESVRKKFTIMGFSPEGLGEAVADLIVNSWKILHSFSQVLCNFGVKLEHEAYKYVCRALNVLKAIPSSTRMPISPYAEEPYARYIRYGGKYVAEHFFAIKTSWFYSAPPMMCYAFWGEIKGLNVQRGDAKYSLPKIMISIAPQTYLGIATIEKKEDNMFVFIYYSQRVW